jgi:uncharacterized phiE125 gp8 family phage protein
LKFMRLVQIEPPGVEPLTAEEAKTRLNIGSEVSDETMDSLIAAARQQLDGRDGWLGRALITQTWRASLDGFPCDEIRMPLPPLQDILSVRYIDASGDMQELDTSGYQVVQGARPSIVPAFGKSWPVTRCQTDAVQIEFVAGYGDDPADVPEPIRSAIALTVSNLRSLTAQNLFLSSVAVEGIETRSFVVGGNAAAAIDAAVCSLLSTYQVYA